MEEIFYQKKFNGSKFESQYFTSMYKKNKYELLSLICCLSFWTENLGDFIILIRSYLSFRVFYFNFSDFYTVYW